AAPLQLGDRVGERLALLDGGLAEPLVVADVHGRGLGLDEADDVPGGPPAGLGDVVGTVVGAGEALDEPARVAALGDGHAGPPGQHRLAQAADLPTGVVDVVLAADVVAAPCEQAG